MNVIDIHEQPQDASDAAPTALRGLNLDRLTALLTTAGFPPFRARQLYHWIFARAAESFDEMTNLPKPLLAWLRENTLLSDMELVRAQGPEDGTRKVLFRLRDGRYVESVLMRDEGAGRTSFCLSSQVGCAMGCEFCLTGFGGFLRNMSTSEIIGQALLMRRHLLAEGEMLHHIVFMGMGEPMLNLDHVIPAVRLISDPDGFAHSRRRITISTSGVIPGMDRLGAENLGIGLAVSLNATTDAIRTGIMPVNKKWPLAELLAAMRRFPMEQRRRITIEYVLLTGINDTPEDARRLVHLLRGVRCKVNLIMFNQSPHLHFKQVDENVLDAFAQILSESHYTVTVRWSKGRDVEAACGQLAAHYFEDAKTHA